MTSEMIVRKIMRVKEGISRNNQMNDITEFDLYVDIVLIVYMMCTKIVFFFLKADARY